MKAYGTVELSAEGVLIRDRKNNAHSFEWSAVRRILAYKLDLITTDDVCLEFCTEDRSYIVDEETVGWSELTAHVSHHFSISTQWLEKLVQPPFATNTSVLWNRATDDALTRFAGADLGELWHASSSDFASDGALRDIYFTETNVEHWNSMLAVARGMFGPVNVTFGARELKHDLTAKHFAGKERALVQLSVGGINVTGYCFSTTELELSFAPVQLHDSSDLAQLLRFVISVSSYISRPALITPENAREIPILQVQPTGAVEFCSPPAA